MRSAQPCRRRCARGDSPRRSAAGTGRSLQGSLSGIARRGLRRRRQRRGATNAEAAAGGGRAARLRPRAGVMDREGPRLAAADEDARPGDRRRALTPGTGSPRRNGSSRSWPVPARSSAPSVRPHAGAGRASVRAERGHGSRTAMPLGYGSSSGGSARRGRGSSRRSTSLPGTRPRAAAARPRACTLDATGRCRAATRPARLSARAVRLPRSACRSPRRGP